jgi:recombination protein RecA
VIAKKIEGNPLDPEKIAKDQKEEVKEEEIPTKKN